MKSESLLASEPEKNPYETNPSDFPIVESEEKEPYFSDEWMPKLKEGMIVHYGKRIGFDEKTKNCFLLLRDIAGLNYIISLTESAHREDLYQLSFKTKEYEYAITDLDEESRDLLFSTVAVFVESSSKYIAEGIKEISISPAGASYSAEEIEQCTQALLASPENPYTKEELETRFKSFRIFDLYDKIFGKDFHEVHYNYKNKSGARARLFKSTIKKYFPDWEVSQDSVFGNDFYVRRKKGDN